MLFRSAIKTSQIAFQAEKGCYLGVPATGGVAAVAPVAGTKSTPTPWPSTDPTTGTYPPTPLAANTGWCVAPTAAGAAVFIGRFTDIGFIASGNVNYWYAAMGQPTGTTVPLAACLLGAVTAAGTAAAGDVGFNASAAANLDGDAGVSFWGSSSDQGSQDCTSGTY